jgi:hypothetical protein
MTPAKIREDAFDVSVRIAVQAKGSTKAKTLLRSVAFAFRDLDGDNSLVLQETSPDRLFCDMQARKPGMKVNHDYLGVSEVVKLVALPPAALQEKHHLSSVAYRETDLPKAVTSGGIRIGEATYKGQAVPVYIPTDVLDETCLPRVAIGGMGTGKTTFGANVATRSVQAGFCSVVIDPAKGEIGDAIEKVLPKEQVVRIRFGSKPYRLDWRESQHGERSLNRLTNEMVAFFEAAAEEAGAQTVRYLRAAAKAAPGESLGGIVRLLTEPMDELTLASIRPSERPLWSSYAELSDARRAQIAAPVLNRLDTILGDDYLSECMEAAEGIDLVELVDSGPKAIVFDVPKGELGAEAVDVLASLIATKIDLAMVLRKTRYPVFVIQDEPHQYIRSSRTWKSAVVESRKWRFAYVWLFHAWEQINHDLAAIIKAACPHYHLFTTSKLTYRALAEEIAPFTVEEAMQTPRHWCLHVIRAAGQTVPPFLAKMDGPIRRQQL